MRKPALFLMLGMLAATAVRGQSGEAPDDGATADPQASWDGGLPPPPPADVGMPTRDAGPPLPPPPPTLVRHTRTAGHTQLQALVMTPPDQAEAARAAAEEAMTEYARVLDLAMASGGVVDLINGEAAVAPVVIPPEVLPMLREALRICQLTGGAYDPTTGVFTALWPFGTGSAQQSPAAEELARRSPLVDCRQVSLDAAARTVTFQKPGITLDLAEPAHAAALDRAMALLRARGFGDAVIYAGGDAVVSGHKAGRRWTVGIQDPRGPGHFAALPMAGGAVFTTGDYEASFMERGRRMHWVLDPRTGMPVRGVRSVTVQARTALEAGLLSRALFAMGVDNGMKLVERLPGVQAVMVDDRNRVWVSKGLTRTLRHRPPLDAP